MGTSVGKLNLMIGADASGMDAGLKDGLSKAEAFNAKVHKKIAEIGAARENAKVSKAAEAMLKTPEDRVKDFAGKIEGSLGVARAGVDLLKGKFDTAGGALGKIGTLASAIPGPWGAAIGSVIGAVGEVVDTINGPLIKAQQSAKAGFMDVATGAKTISQAMSDIKVQTLTEGLERMVRARQNVEQFANLIGGGGARGFLANFTPGGGLQQLRQQLDPRAQAQVIAQQAQQRQDLMQELLANEGMRNVRRSIAGEQAGQGLMEMARAPRLMLAQRTINRSLRGEQGFNRAAVETNLMTIALDRFRSQGIEPTERQLQGLREMAQITAESLRQQYAVLASDQAVTNLRNEIAVTNLDADAQQIRTLRLVGAAQATIEYVRALQLVRNAGQLGESIQRDNDQMSRQIGAFGMTAREAGIYNRELERRDLLARLANANVDRLSAAERRALQANLDRINAGINAARANDQVMTRLEAQQQLRQETTQANASRNHFFEQMEHPGEFIADMSREEAQLAQLRLRGAEQWRIQLQEANIEALRGVRTQQLIAQAGFQTFQQTRTPLEQYEAQLERLETMRRSGVINEDTHARAVNNAANQLMSTFGTEHGAGTGMEAGGAAAQAAIARNNRRVTGADRAEQIRNTVERLRQIQDEQLREIREMARNLRNAPPMRPMNLGG